MTLQSIHSFIITIIMNDEYKTTVEKLLTDGSNWVIYRDCMIWSLRSRGLQNHLMRMMTSPAYIAMGDINNMTPQMRWQHDEAVAMQLIATSILNSAFTNIKGKTNTKEVWDALKGLYKGRITMVLVRLSQQFQSNMLPGR